ncbi:(2Fe-2S)-binding protein [Gluconacetobacter aggeris]|uniref:(2Fe-2S)-binding protein n=1 Tax=Gluconacetobacter aggeris TaxID=1286186 RepID=A0A7W4IWK2_9PROT|nr:(2Fe-2S)-binding protein [Gluconacetobacter aggeris]MBB2170379.1 (2Fe-2S)-binding protein [Gluconacetobacter aggeris]
MPPAVVLTVNGTGHVLDVPPDTTLLHVLRNDLGLNGPKYGCGLGECGACSVLVGGRVARSCGLAVGDVAGWPVTTLEGLARDGVPDPVQRAFVAEQAAQCGYCLNGMVMTVRALLNVDPAPDDATLLAALRGVLCRCGTHVEILRAARLACGLAGGAATGGEAA